MNKLVTILAWIYAAILYFTPRFITEEWGGVIVGNIFIPVEPLAFTKLFYPHEKWPHKCKMNLFLFMKWHTKPKVVSEIIPWEEEFE